ncbi:hypothetical protein I4U23_009646 [Adineta vaga]|nr:hypothetical protein I4U23_009646 [Adineta vaga]
MEDDSTEKFNQVTQRFKENFRSQMAETNNKRYIDQLHQTLDRWYYNNNELIQEVLAKKRRELDELYRQYSNEFNDKYSELEEKLRENSHSSDLNDQLEEFNVYCQCNTIEKRLRINTEEFSNNEITEKIQIEYVPYRSVVPSSAIIPLKPTIRPVRRLSFSTGTSPLTATTEITILKEPEKDTTRQYTDKQEPISRPIIYSTERKSTVTKLPSRTTIVTNDDDDDAHIPKSTTQLYIGLNATFIPVLVNKNRECSDENNEIIEYSIDSIQIPHNEEQQRQYQQPSNVIDENEKLVRAYKILIENENNHQQHLTLLSNNDQEQTSSSASVFNLKHLNQIDYSTIMFQKCTTQFNCMASSAQQNELVVYNSELKVLIILQHGKHQTCRHRFYLNWPEEFSANISDITYSHDNDEYLISTWDSSHIYSFNRRQLSIYDLGKLSKDLPLRRIYCFHRFVYCILGNNYLLEFEFNESYMNLQFTRTKIVLYDPRTLSQDTAYQLLDVACDGEYLVVVYVGDNDDICLQTIHRQTRKFHSDFVLDKPQHINRSYVRIEPTIQQGNFIYLNGQQNHLKAIDLNHGRDGEVTTVVSQRTKPTNICFLADGRFVILHEEPYFLSVHGTHQR